MKSPVRLIKIHLQLGYVLAAPIFVGILCIITLVDFFRFSNLDRSLFSAISLAYDQFDVLDSIYVFLIATIVVPVSLAILRVVQGSWLRSPGFLGKKGVSVAIVHISLSLLLSWMIFVAQAFPIASGPLATDIEIGYVFKPFGSQFISLAFLNPTIKWICLIGPSLLISSFQLYFADRREEKGRFDLYIQRVKLANLGSGLYPVEGRHKGNFNVGAITPAILDIRKEANSLNERYQSLQPGSLPSKQFLDECFNECKKHMSRILGIENIDPSKYTVCIGENTTKVLHALINKGNYDCVIMSPFEHDSEISIVKLQPEIIAIESNSSILSDPNSSKEVVSNLIIGKLTPGKNLLVISEICCKTGLRVPIDDIVTSILDGKPIDSKLEILVDGAHVVGQATSRFIDHGEAFIFSGHKWLYSESPSGIAIIFNDRLIPDTYYDIWLDGTPTSTGNHRSIFDLLAALRWRLNLADLTDLVSRSKNLTEYFTDILPIGVEIIGKNLHIDESQIRTISPSDNFSWTNAALKEKLSSFGISCEVFKITKPNNETVDWIRLCFPYFLDTTSVDELIDSIKNTIQN